MMTVLLILCTKEELTQWVNVVPFAAEKVLTAEFIKIEANLRNNMKPIGQ